MSMGSAEGDSSGGGAWSARAADAPYGQVKCKARALCHAHCTRSINVARAFL